MRPRIQPICSVLLLMVMVVGSALAQTTTGALAGAVRHDGAPLPGVTVTIASPALQGMRVAHTNAKGDFIFLALPPGSYSVTFAMDGLQTVRQSARIGLASTQRVDVAMQPSVVAEAITVVGADMAIIESTDVQTNLEASLVESLPVSRTIQGAIDLAPGVTTTTAGNVVVSGAYAYDTLYLINGGVTNENISGQTESLYVEDAIQEITVMTGSISAEYGRFTGGVVSVITKSGGNEFSGSFRDSLTNPSWAEPSDYGETKAESELNETYEVTLGGRIVRDRLWFFGAGRQIETTTRDFYVNSVEQLLEDATDDRFEVKLTTQLHPKHSVVASYLSYDRETSPHCEWSCWEPSAIDQDGRRTPQELVVASYNGILTSDILIEAGYSTRELRFVDSGGEHVTTDFADARDLALGTWSYDLHYGGVWGAPVFCGACGEESRENEAYNLKGTWYLATRDVGTHNVVAGYEDFAESRFLNNYWAASDFNLYTYYGGAPTRVGPISEPGTLRPVIAPGDWIYYDPVDERSRGSDWVTRALFANDKWDLGSKWSFNVGVRYDENDGRNSGGDVISKDSNLSPRLGATWDVRGDGRFRVNASHSRYVSRVQESVGNQGGAGGFSWYEYVYDGPVIGGADSGLSSFDVLEQMFAWLLGQGWSPDSRLEPSSFTGAFINGLNVRLDGTLQSPYVDEMTIGFATQLGQSGFVRLDYIDKDWGDFYVGSTTPGHIAYSEGEPLDIITITNCGDCRERSYQGVQVQAGYRFGDRVSTGANYTWSETTGNILGEQFNGAATWDNILTYPEYNSFERHRPVGPLSNDQTHKLRAWIGWDVPLGKFGALNLSLLERFDSGRPYQAAAGIPVQQYVECHPCGYANPPPIRQYFFSDRGEYRWEDATATDIAINYEVPVSRINLFVQSEVLNVFDEQAQIGGYNFVLRGAPFNPFTETPVEGVHWVKPALFGQPSGPGSYQQPRTFRFSLGIRF